MDILLIEDNESLAANVGEYLEEQGDVVDYAGDGLTGLHLATVNRYDAIVLDLQLPGMDGLTLCQRLRRDGGDTTPLLMLTARDTERDKLAGFEVGADDYLTKPFSLPELRMRLGALVRRATGTDSVLRVADLEFNLTTMIVRRAGVRLDIKPSGLRMLERLMRASPAVVPRAEIERCLWGDDPPASEASLRGHIYQLRTVIDGGHAVKLLTTVHGIGYRLAPDDAL